MDRSADQRLIADVLDREGGYSNRAPDRGGPTNFGITQATLSAYLRRPASIADVQNLSRDTAVQIYTQIYLTAPGIGRIADDALRGLVFDAAVQHGPARAVQWLQALVGTATDGVIGSITFSYIAAHDSGSLYRRYLARRLCFYGEIISADAKRGTPPEISQAQNAAGWMNRLAPFIEATP